MGVFKKENRKGDVMMKVVYLKEAVLRQVLVSLTDNKGVLFHCQDIEQLHNHLIACLLEGIYHLYSNMMCTGWNFGGCAMPENVAL